MKPACQITHPQIVEGTCPWCGILIGAGDTTKGSVDRIWDASAIASALDDSNEHVRSMTIANLQRSAPSEIAVPLLAKALNDSSQRIRSLAEQALGDLGPRMKLEEVQRFESQIAGSPHELALTILALGYYSLGVRESAAARDRRRQHVLWLIRNAPETATAGGPLAFLHDEAEGYAAAKELWLYHVRSHPANTRILGNAARFFTIYDDRLSEQLLKRARDLEPANPEWSERLGQLYLLHAGSSPLERTDARNALREFRVAEQLRLAGVPLGETSGSGDKTREWLSRMRRLPQLARAAFEAGEFEESRNYALELLEIASSSELPEFFGNDGNAIHYGNLILGRIALRAGDVAHAKQRLLDSGRTSGSPNLGSFGPNMTLAKELLELGEREVVLQYFELCAAFWKSGKRSLEKWAVQVRAGAMPAFGANLRY